MEDINDTISYNAPKIIIMTTAIDRPELHSKVFPSYLKYIEGLDYEWIITINTIFGKASDTVNYFKDIIPESRLHIKIFETGGTLKHHWDSAKYVINTARQMADERSMLFYFEDDWILIDDKYSLVEDIGIINDDKIYVGLVKREYDINVISFNPSLWTYTAFGLPHSFINNPEISYEYQCNRKSFITEAGELYSNPERVCCPRDNNFPIDNYVEKIEILKRFKDVGRDWQNKTIKCRTFAYKK